MHFLSVDTFQVEQMKLHPYHHPPLPLSTPLPPTLRPVPTNITPTTPCHHPPICPANELWTYGPILLICVVLLVTQIGICSVIFTLDIF